MRVGLFGLLGAGNVGNDGSLEAVLAHLRTEHPDALLNALCSGPDAIAARYGIPSTQLNWYYARERGGGRLVAIALKALGKVVDPLRVLGWVRRNDVVIVPGAGVLENTLPVRPWGFPYSLFLLCLAGRLTGTRVALVGIGANVIRQRATRRLFRVAARLAHYRSFRDRLSRDSMREMGVDTSADEIYPDLAFALPTPTAPVQRGTVAVGVMDFHGGGNDPRRDAGRIHQSYLDSVKRFVRWLVDEGRQVRLLTGDEYDFAVAAEVLADVRTHRPDLDPSTVVFEPTRTLGELMDQIAVAEVVVGTRYHNVLCALKLAKPTVSISYSAKSDRIMDDMGLGEFCQDARAVDVDRLIEQLTALEREADRIRLMLAERSAAKAVELERQFAVLDARLFPVTEPAVARRAP